ncbi:MAG: hypothetical protein IPL46_02580 [Saprospiraceae bacterium]|nr:hypothetical protein [Saprospiraceae bacterium]
MNISNSNSGVLTSLGALVLCLLGIQLHAQTFPTPTGFTLPAGKTICITYEVDVNANACPVGTVPPVNISNQSNVSGTNFTTVLTDDPDNPAPNPSPTITPFGSFELGNLVFNDLNRDGLFNGMDAGINMVSLNLYQDNGDNVLTVADGAVIATATTSGGGLYSFNVCPGSYIVEIAPANFIMGGALYNTGAPFVSSPISGALDPDNNVDNDDNGDPVSGFGIASQAITISASNTTLDFGLKTPTIITINDVMMAEGTGGTMTSFVFMVTRSSTEDAISLTVNTAHVTTNGSDFTAISGGTVSFTAGGNLIETISVPVNHDNMVEPDETFTVNLSGAPPHATISDGSGEGTIVNDDTDVSVAVSPSSVLEDDAANLVYTFTRTGVTTGMLTVNFSVGGTATFSSDYSQMGASTFTSMAGSVIFGAGNTMATVTVNPSLDSGVEPDETVVLTVTSGTGYNVGSPSFASGTITNDDADVSVAVSPLAVDEDGIPNLEFTFTRTGAMTDMLTVNFSVAGTADFGTDYTQTGAATYMAMTGSVTMGSGNATAIVTIDPMADMDLEPDETVLLTVTTGTGYNIGSPSMATGTITNDDNSVSVAVSPSAVDENGVTNLIYTFTRTDVTTGALVVNFDVGGTASLSSDYTESGSTTFGASSGTVTFSGMNPAVSVTIDPSPDAIVEANETVVLTVTSGMGYGVGAPTGATGTITNDDAATLTLSGGTAKNEGNMGMTAYTFTATLSAAVEGGFDIAYKTNDGSATIIDGDYTDNDGTLSFTGMVNEMKDIIVNVNGDMKVEDNETFTVALGPISMTSLVQQTAITVSGGVQTDTITNDDVATLTLTGGTSKNEGNMGTTEYTFTATLNAAVQDGFKVAYTTNDGSATIVDGDYSDNDGILSFLGTANEMMMITVNVNGDAKVEANEDFTVALGAISMTSMVQALAISKSGSPQTGMITNDDMATITLTGPMPTNEGNSGTTPFVFTATLDNPVQGGLTVNFNVQDGTATDADDFEVATVSPLNFSGTMGEMQSITVNANGDNKVEVDEEFMVSLGTPSVPNVSVAGSPKTGTILNDEIDFGDAPASYGSASHTTLVTKYLGNFLDGDPMDQPSAAADGDDTDAEGDDEDGVTLPGAFIIGTMADISVNASDAGLLDAWVDFNADGDFADMGEHIFTDEALVMGNNPLSFAVPMAATLGNSFARFRFSTLGGLSYNGLAADGEVEDYQVTFANTLFSINDPMVIEGNTGTSNLVFTVSRNNSSVASSINYSVTGGTATVADSDFQPVAPDTLDFMIGELEKTITVMVIGDNKVEMDETVEVTLTNPVNAGIMDGMGIGTIKNDDAAIVTINNPSKSEGNTGTSVLTFTVMLSQPANAEVTLDYETMDGTAEDENGDGDYDSKNGMLSFMAGQTSKQVDITINGDCDIEPAESFL